ncbi:MAG: TetR/AcrR family transcriptional regulator [Emergencia sp.]
MNTGITSKEAILRVCCDIVASKGLAAVNMRSVADQCQIALGTLYNYFDSKDELLLATVEEIWREIFHRDSRSPAGPRFSEYVEYIFACVQKGAESYPGFFTAHSVSIASSGKEKAKSSMNHYFRHMKEELLQVLETDDSVSDEAFSPSFEKEDFVDFVLDNLLMLLIKGKTSCRLLIEVICRTIYNQ